MKNFKKIVLILDENNKPVELVDIKEVSIDEYLKHKKACETNLKNKIDEKAEKEEIIKNKFDDLFKRLSKVEKELAYNRGDITLEEYERED